MPNVNDVIEIVIFDEDSKMHLRRVRVRAADKRGNKFRITGVNLRGKNPVDYTINVLPTPAGADMRNFRKPNTTYWSYSPSVKGDE